MQNAPHKHVNATLFVEGEEDHNFITALLRHCGITPPNQQGDTITLEQLRGIGNNKTLLGKTKIQTITQKIQASTIALFVLDADGNPDLAQRRRAFEKIKPQFLPPYTAAHLLPDDRTPEARHTAAHLFLLPDDRTPGTLETLLKRISTDQNIYPCMDKYRECLRNQPPANNATHYAPPTDKDDVYAYCQANRINADKGKIDFTDPRYWNLDSPPLAPLKQFLTAHLAPPPPKLP